MQKKCNLNVKNKKKKIIVAIFLIILIGVFMFLLLRTKANKNYIMDSSIDTIISLNSENFELDDMDKKIQYDNYEIFLITEDYEDYNLKCLNTKDNAEQIIDTSVDCVTILNNTLYYFKNTDDSTIFFSYNLDTMEKENLNMPDDLCRGIYTIVAYDDNVYFSINGYNLHNYSYGIIQYNIKEKEYKLFSDLDIRDLDENFLFIENGFLTVQASTDSSSLIYISLNGNEEIKYEFEGYLSEEIVRVDDNLIEIPVLGLDFSEYGGPYWDYVGYIKINIKNYSVTPHYSYE